MAEYIRRMVSGNKARFKDGKLNLELDLVYITDQVIIMGYPAAGIEGLYRNRREDAKKFLEHRHGKNFWVFNFCPVRENSYPGSFFEGRVSRYPFPDHHAPPLAIMPLAAREIHAWLRGSRDRVAVLHCKAGKGRSGTMACSYLLSLDDDPSPPRLERSYNAKQWAKIRADDMMQVIQEDDADDGRSKQVVSLDCGTSSSTQPLAQGDQPQRTETPTLTSSTSADATSTRSFTESLKGVLDLHTTRRMKAPSSPDKKVKQGVSIPSQRRWLYYWALLLAHDAPAHLWAIPPSLSPSNPDLQVKAKPASPKVRLKQIVLRMRETSGVKKNLMRAANLVIDRTGMAKNGVTETRANDKEQVWVSLARYDDDLVELLERWEAHTRGGGDGEGGVGHMGRRRQGSEHMGNEAIGQLFEDESWDRGKMVRSFARFGVLGDDAIVKEGNEKDGKTVTYTLRPLSDANWVNIRDELQPEQQDNGGERENSSVPASETNSMYDVTQGVKGGKGIVLDAGREVRVKLYVGQVFMGWLWFIPTFHLPHPPPTSTDPPYPTTKFILTRKELDFPLGLGSWIIDVEISLEWLRETDTEAIQPPARQIAEGGNVEGSNEPSGIPATVQVVMAASGRIGEAMEAKQAAED